MKKILSLTLSLTMVLMLNIPVQSETEPTRYLAYAEFTDYDPDLIHDEPRVEEVISCNMVVKPKTQVLLSRLCESAITNVNYYFNEDDANVQKGPDTLAEADGIYYPGTRVISNSYIGGTVNYKVSGDFQTKKTTGDIVHLEVPSDSYQPVEIIDSKTLYLDMGEEYTLSQPTGDQSQPNWIGTKQAYPSLSGRYINWTFRFGSLNSSNSSGAFGLFKAKMENFDVVSNVNYSGPELVDMIISDPSNEQTSKDEATAVGMYYASGVLYMNTVKEQPLNEENGLLPICKKAKKLVMQYNLDPNANTGAAEDGWLEIDSSQANLLKIVEKEDEEGNTAFVLEYPDFANAWGRIIAVIEIPSESYRPSKRVRVKSRISSYGGYKFNNLQEGDVVKIYNVNGKKVAELNAGTADGFEWLGREGTNNSGDWAKSGIYIYQIKLKKDGKIISGTISFVW